jgi:hypothetical protein
MAMRMHSRMRKNSFNKTRVMVKSKKLRAITLPKAYTIPLRAPTTLLKSCTVLLI